MLESNDIPDPEVRKWFLSKNKKTPKLSVSSTEKPNLLWLKVSDLLSEHLCEPYIQGYWDFLRSGEITRNNAYFSYITYLSRSSLLGYGKWSHDELKEKAQSRFSVIQSMKRSGFDNNEPIKLLDFKYKNEFKSARDINCNLVTFDVYDGHHRVCAANFVGLEYIPAIRGTWPKRSIGWLANMSMKENWEWYQPLGLNEPHNISFGNPDDNRHGRKKYEYILRRNIEPIRGRRFLDLGCNAGVISSCLAEGFASKVVGIDYPKKIKQARAVHSTLWMDYGNLSFHGMDLYRTEDFERYLKTTGSVDCIIMCNFIYYLGDKIDTFMDICVDNCSQILLQGNRLKTHNGVRSARIPSQPNYRGEYSQIEGMVELLKRHGFSSSVDAPAGYPKPVVVGVK